ncbi:MAG: ABC transporter permease [Vicinamibacterales bacterium]
MAVTRAHAMPPALDGVEELDGTTRARSRAARVRLISILVVLGTWELVGRQVSPLFMASPSAVAIAAVRLVRNGELIAALLSSMQTLMLGFAIAAVVGVVLGLLIGRYRLVDAATDWLINALYSTPLVAITPLVILWFGLGDVAKLFIVSILAVFPILINTAAGVRNVPHALIDVGTAFAANERQIFTKIILPAAVPYIMTGLRLGIGRAIIAMVVAEFFTAITGLGALIVKFGNQFDTASMFVPILVLMIMGIGLTALVRRAEDAFAPWRTRDD